MTPTHSWPFLSGALTQHDLNGRHDAKMIAIIRPDPATQPVAMVNALLTVGFSLA
jgi:hypothetical protein